ncbi:hypothetical protein OE88DRAFT_1656533 [Heliocybe sulcata]|uniref:Peptidase C14 caspase domain-containing protein n=1 Tax=Heliocybe sulcata TaxID=5364 RepID=A0A5C3N6I4_9AGAM|nr:hypothetical protein OE88DRAFT_1656533 [Heliocybe sulcata]
MRSWLKWCYRMLLGNHPSAKASAHVEGPAIRGSRLFAVIIGINHYQDLQVPSLRGAVTDADAVRDFLEISLDVPSSQIYNLRNRDATRSSIIDAFTRLTTDNRIEPGDPILIFYAGHGGSATSPPGWDGTKSELLIPYDYEAKATPMTHGIPDRTIASLLDSLAAAKGDNITVIFDCCHSGSGTRSDKEDPTYRVRGIDVVSNVPPSLDKKIWAAASQGRAGDLASGFLRSGMRSHVLLAACGSGEKARERNGRGVFTTALLDVLVSRTSSQMTYTQLVDSLPSLPEQSPQCEGFHRNRPLFDDRAPLHANPIYKVRVQDGKYTMDAGAAHGIADEAVFALYTDPLTSLDALLIPVANVVQVADFETTLEAPLPSSTVIKTDVLFAKQTLHGKLATFGVYAPHGQLHDIVNELANRPPRIGRSLYRLALVDESAADLRLGLEGDNVIFDFRNPLSAPYVPSQLPVRLPLVGDRIHRAIQAAAHYSWHLHRDNTNSHLSLQIGVEFTQVEATDEWDRRLRRIARPTGPNLIADGLLDISVDGDPMYGIKLTNPTSKDIYPSVFFFDAGDLSIKSWYQSPTSSGRVDPPLPAGGSLTIGYGSSGASPFHFFLNDGQDIDVGFIKIFLSTRQVDLSDIGQHSPFDVCRCCQESPGMYGGWSTITITVLQRRGPTRA